MHLTHINRDLPDEWLDRELARERVANALKSAHVADVTLTNNGRQVRLVIEFETDEDRPECLGPDTQYVLSELAVALTVPPYLRQPEFEDPKTRAI